MNEAKHVLRVLLATVVVSCSFAQAGDVSWMPGTSGPSGWAIEPVGPTDSDIIAFSGPVRTFLNRCVAEQSLGGQPRLAINAKSKTIELQFVPPARDDCADFLDPVSGLEGSFGPLETGSWSLFCSQKDVTFSLSFEVGIAGEIPDQRVYYVDARATGRNNGLSWADAFVHLQTALAATAEGGEIRVAKGTYRPDQGAGYSDWNPYAAFYLAKGVILKGGYAGSNAANPNLRDIVTYETVLSGDIDQDDEPLTCFNDMADDPSRADNCFHVVVTSGTDATTVLDGFTITGGHAFAKETRYNSEATEVPEYGGGLYNDAGSPIIRNCVITGNGAASFGGGLYHRGPTAPTLIDCTISDNWCQWWGGGLVNDSSSHLTLSGCAIAGNAALYRGGGIANRNNTVLTISNCILSGNAVMESIHGQGGGLYNLGGTAVLNHCTIVGNQASLGRAILCDSLEQAAFSDVRVSNSIVWNQSDPFWCADLSGLDVTYCNVEGGWAGTGNIAADPCFIEVGYWDLRDTPEEPCDDLWYDGDYRLSWESPCVDGGNPLDTPDADAVDFYGNPRLSGPAVDMGAYELRNEPPVAIAGPDVSGFTLDNTTGTVTLDAGASYDPEGLPLTYHWYRDGKKISAEAAFDIEIPVGEVVFTLIVNDGANDSEPDTVVARVYQVIDTSISAPETISHRSSRGTFIAAIRVPNRRSWKEFDNAEPLLFFPGGIQASHHRVVPWITGHTFVFGTFNKKDFLAAVPQKGRIEVRIVGRLKDGRYFSGTDTVKVK